MKRKIIISVSMALLAAALLAGCGSPDSQGTAENRTISESQENQESRTISGSQEIPENQETSGSAETVKPQEISEMSEPETGSGNEKSSGEAGEKPAAPAAVLEDGIYTAEFDTDSSMFHISEACEGKGTLVVENGQMTIHVSLASKNIVNLFPGLAEDAGKAGASLLEPTTDSVTYSDGITEEVYGFDIPVPALDEEFDLALIGKKGKWYDHKVSVSNPEKTES